jgi:hypothetical protein
VRYAGSGSDVFVLRDSANSCYLDYSYANIRDWSASDRLKTLGSVSNYSFDKTQNLVGSSGKDTQIFYQDDLVAVLQDTTTFTFSLSAVYSLLEEGRGNLEAAGKY